MLKQFISCIDIGEKLYLVAKISSRTWGFIITSVVGLSVFKATESGFVPSSLLCSLGVRILPGVKTRPKGPKAPKRCRSTEAAETVAETSETSLVLIITAPCGS